MIAVPLLGVQAVASNAPSVIHYAAIGPGEIIVVAIVFGSAVAVFTPLIRAWSRRIEGKGTPAVPLAGVEERLDRIERAVDAMSLEVERISEGQRFVTKLLAEKASPQLPPHNP